MSVCLSKYLCKVALVKSKNPLPQFRDKNTNFDVINSNEVPQEYSKYLGYECGKRLYPYKKQDRYTRNCKESSLPSIILENEFLKATFLPSLGGRLISLFDKVDNRELLFANKNIQMGNLAIRDAWFSGGIEWNIGQYGHSLTTSDDVFASVQKDQDNNDFLRIFEFERMHEIYWHIDFHLPPKSKLLYAKGTIYNTNDKDTSLYCWTNTALEKTEYTRVFSNTKEALFLNPFLKDNQKGYDYITLPNVEKLPSLDISYPKRFPYSNEYFFTSNHSKVPYEVTLEKEGQGFLDISTDSLGYRKMFCWGEQPGGKHWESFLSPSTTGEYFEAQSGAAPSQLHGEILEKKSSFTFTQAFTSIQVDPTLSHHEDYNIAFDGVKGAVNQKISDSNVDIYLMDEKFAKDALTKPVEILHTGSGFGFLNSIKNIDDKIPSTFIFNRESLKEDENIYLNLLNDKKLDIDYVNTDFEYPPLSYKKILQNTDSFFAKYLEAVMEVENLNYDIALTKFIELGKKDPNCLISRNIAYLYYQNKEINNCYDWYEKALKQATKSYYIFIAEEYSKILVENDEFDKAKQLLNSISSDLLQSSDILILDLAIVSAKNGDVETLKKCLFDRELANIREGENPFPYLYYEYLSLLESKKTGIDVSDTIRETIKKNNKIPFNLDFTVLLQEDN